jgi:hypothetical protein
MDPANIQEFAERRWDLVESSKRQERAARLSKGGPAACLEVLSELRERYLRLHPEGYSDESRARTWPTTSS